MKVTVGDEEYTGLAGCAIGGAVCLFIGCVFAFIGAIFLMPVWIMGLITWAVASLLN